MRHDSPNHAREAVDPTPARVALAEDDPAQRDLIADTLREHGFEVIEASDGASLLSILQRSAVTVVVSDLWMPALTGSDVVTTRRREGDTTPFVLITAAPPWVTEYVASLDGVTVLRKPFTESKLLDTIERLLARR